MENRICEKNRVDRGRKKNEREQNKARGINN